MQRSTFILFHVVIRGVWLQNVLTCIWNISTDASVKTGWDLPLFNDLQKKRRSGFPLPSASPTLGQNQDGRWRAAVVLRNMVKIRGCNQHTCITPVSGGHSLGTASLGPPLHGLSQVQVKMSAGLQPSQGSAWWGYSSKLTQWCLPEFTSLLALGWTHPCVSCPVGPLLY